MDLWKERLIKRICKEEKKKKKKKNHTDVPSKAMIMFRLLKESKTELAPSPSLQSNAIIDGCCKDEHNWTNRN